MRDARDAETLDDIRAAVQRITSFVQGATEAEFQADEEKQSAVMYQILVIGEAVKRLSAETRAAFDQIAWRQMAGMRDFLVHHYDKVDLDVVWEAATGDVPHLLSALTEIQD